MEPFDLLTPDYRYYDYEFERYWHFFQVFGRVAYNPNTPSEVWEREFERRFGKEAAPHIAAAPGQEILVRATIRGKSPIRLARVAYRSSEKGLGANRGNHIGYRFADLRQVSPRLYHGRIPASGSAQNFRYFIEAVDEKGHRVTFPDDGWIDPILLRVTPGQEAPVVDHTPVREARAGQALTIRVKASDPSGIKWVRLRYRGVNQHYDYQALPTRPTGRADEYEAGVPAEHISPRWDFMYFIEAMDNASNGRIFPDLYRETPYVIVPLQREE